MTYQIAGLPRDDFSALFTMDAVELARAGAVRVVADEKPGYPCRVSLVDAEPGEVLILLHYVSHDVATPYRSAYAIYVRENAETAPPLVDALPPVFEGRTLALRGFGEDGMIREAVLAQPGEVEGKIRALFGREDVAYIHAHNAVYGCFAARIDRG